MFFHHFFANLIFKIVSDLPFFLEFFIGCLPFSSFWVVLLAAAFATFGTAGPV